MGLSNYPPGLSDNTPGAPWNEPVVPEEEFEITVSQSLSKATTVWTQDYVPECDMGYEDGVGYCDRWNDTTWTDWHKAFNENGHFTPFQLIQKLEEYVQKDLEDAKKDCEPQCKDWKKNQRVRYLTNLLEECKDWVEDDLEIVKD